VIGVWHMGLDSEASALLNDPTTADEIDEMRAHGRSL
jgi:hypothetical protein